jgi:hypothetical protein
MGFRAGAIAGLLLVVPVIGQCSGATPPEAAAPANPGPALLPQVSTFTWRSSPNSAFRAGEDLQYVLKWGVITGGRSTLSIPQMEKVGSREAYHVVSEAQTTGIADVFYKTRDRNETWLDAESLVTLRLEKHIREGKYKVEAAIEFDQETHRYRDYSNRLDKGTSEYAEGVIPDYVMDVLGSLYYVRTLPLEVGKSYTMDVYEGKKIWPLVVNVRKIEKVHVPAGKFTCFRVEPVLREPGIFVSKGKKLEVWLTTDERRIPVQMRSEVAIGHVAAELVKYQLEGDPAAALTPASNPAAQTP